VSISTTGVDSGKMLHFRVTSQGASMAFMAYKLNGERYVRANVCPPCGSVGFSLSGDILVCDRCGTRFKASTGAGISGACRDYPKAEVAHVISGDNLTMDIDDLVTAYENTQRPGWP
jgi:nitrite reductase/ring-hydroxylating ferredoxin subunit